MSVRRRIISPPYARIACITTVSPVGLDLEPQLNNGRIIVEGLKRENVLDAKIEAFFVKWLKEVKLLTERMLS